MTSSTDQRLCRQSSVAMMQRLSRVLSHLLPGMLFVCMSIIMSWVGRHVVWAYANSFRNVCFNRNTSTNTNHNTNHKATKCRYPLTGLHWNEFILVKTTLNAFNLMVCDVTLNDNARVTEWVIHTIIYQIEKAWVRFTGQACSQCCMENEYQFIRYLTYSIIEYGP